MGTCHTQSKLREDRNGKWREMGGQVVRLKKGWPGSPPSLPLGGADYVCWGQAWQLSGTVRSGREGRATATNGANTDIEQAFGELWDGEQQLPREINQNIDGRVETWSPHAQANRNLSVWGDCILSVNLLWGTQNRPRTSFASWVPINAEAVIPPPCFLLVKSITTIPLSASLSSSGSPLPPSPKWAWICLWCCQAHNARQAACKEIKNVLLRTRKLGRPMNNFS